MLVSTAEGRVKHSNVLRDPRVAVSVVSSEDPLDMASARGRVARIAPDYDYAYADELARRYMGRDRYPFRRPGERRTTLWILPASVHVMPALRPDESVTFPNSGSETRARRAPVPRDRRREGGGREKGAPPGAGLPGTRAGGAGRAKARPRARPRDPATFADAPAPAPAGGAARGKGPGAG